MSEPIVDVEAAKIMTALLLAQRDVIRETAKQDVWGAKFIRTVNYLSVYLAGSLVAIGIGIGALSGIIWLFVQMKHLLGG